MVSLFVNHRPADRKNDGDDRQHRRHLELVLALYVQRPRQEGRGVQEVTSAGLRPVVSTR